VRIEHRFNGPPNSAHGGAARGMFAVAVNPRSASVRLLSPPPLDVDLNVEADGGNAVVTGPDGPVAQVRPHAADHDFEPLTLRTQPEIDAAQQQWIDDLWPDRIFPTCFGRGHLRPLGDRLEPYAGQVPDTKLAAAYWIPDPSLAVDGNLPDLVPWAVVDCPSGGAVVSEVGEDSMMLLGELALQILETPVLGERYQVIARSNGRKGRRLRSDVAILNEDNGCLAYGTATWIELDRPVEPTHS
jgi:hypothetical protein